jgi:hypothetical protein
MQDLERELAQYGAVLRDRAPAVGLDEVETRLARPPTGHRPVLAAVAGALVALASIGLMFVGGLLVDLLGTTPTSPRPSVSPASGASTGPAVMAIVVGSGALAVLAGAAAVGLKHHRKNQEPKRIAKTRERRKKKMQTTEKPVAPVEKLARNNRFLIIGLVVAVLLAAGFGAWLIVDNTRTGIEADIVALLDDYGAAWAANDGEAVAALMTDNGSALAGNGVTYEIEQLKSVVDSLGSNSSERIGDPLIVERSTYWMVADASLMDLGGPQAVPNLDLFRIVERDGRFLIEYHETWRG